MKYKPLVLTLAFGLSIVALARLCHRATDGFAMTKVEGTVCAGAAEDLSLPPEEMFTGPFTYFSRGLQCFAFLSADGEYVLKLLNNRNQHKAKIFHWIPGCEEKAQKAELKMEQLFHSYALAFRELKEETGLIYIHIHPTDHLKKTITLIDKLGIAHTLDLDKTGFMVQKRATLFYPYLAAKRKAKDHEGAKKAVDELVDMLVARCKKGIWDNDPLFRTNFGFVNDHPIEIDVGPFSINPTITDPAVYVPEVRRITASLKDWAAKNYPELAPFIEDKVEEVR